LQAPGQNAVRGIGNQGLMAGFRGVYGCKCKPHYAMGMVGLVVVGSSDDIDQAMSAKHPGKAKKVFAELLEKVESTTTAAK